MSAKRTATRLARYGGYWPPDAPQQRGTYKDGRKSHQHYVRWAGMVSRCHNPKAPDYGNYGGRGIVVCKEWRDNPFAFYQFLETLGPRPAGHTLDRIDVDGNYEPGNLRWASVLEQNTNRRPQRARLTLRRVKPGVWVIGRKPLDRGPILR